MTRPVAVALDPAGEAAALVDGMSEPKDTRPDGEAQDGQRAPGSADDTHSTKPDPGAAHVELDADGLPWDGEIHAATRTKTKAGRWARKRTKRAQSEPQQISQHVIVGRACSGMTVQLMVGIFGPDWIPVQTDQFDERAQLDMVFTEYCRAKELNDIPPGVALSLGLAMYALPRFTDSTQTRSRMGRIWKGIKDKMRRKSKIRVVPADKETKGEGS